MYFVNAFLIILTWLSANPFDSGLLAVEYIMSQLRACSTFKLTKFIKIVALSDKILDGLKNW